MKRYHHVGRFFQLDYPSSWRYVEHSNPSSGVLSTYFLPPSSTGKDPKDWSKGVEIRLHYLPPHLPYISSQKAAQRNVLYQIYLGLYTEQYEDDKNCRPTVKRARTFLNSHAWFGSRLKGSGQGKFLCNAHQAGRQIDAKHPFEKILTQPHLNSKIITSHFLARYKGRPCLKHRYRSKFEREESLVLLHIFAPPEEFEGFARQVESWFYKRRYLSRSARRQALIEASPRLCSPRKDPKESKSSSPAQRAISRGLPSTVSISYEFNVKKKQKTLVRIPGGTGVVISNKGHILTNQHAVISQFPQNKAPQTIYIHWDHSDKGPPKGLSMPLQVRFVSAIYQPPRYGMALRLDRHHGRQSVEGHAQYVDIALLKIPDVELKKFSPSCIPMMSSEELALGAQVAALGFPWEGKGIDDLGTTSATATLGHISRLLRIDTWRIFRDLRMPKGSRINELQHTAKTSGGNSGGPLLDVASGKLVGLNTRGGIFDKRVFEQPDIRPGLGLGFSFALPVDLAWQYFPDYLLKRDLPQNPPKAKKTSKRKKNTPKQEREYGRWREMLRVWLHFGPQRAALRASKLLFHAPEVKVADYLLAAQLQFQLHQKTSLPSLHLTHHDATPTPQGPHKIAKCFEDKSAIKNAFCFLRHAPRLDNMRSVPLLLLEARIRLYMAQEKLASRKKEQARTHLMKAKAALDAIRKLPSREEKAASTPSNPAAEGPRELRIPSLLYHEALYALYYARYLSLFAPPPRPDGRIRSEHDKALQKIAKVLEYKRMLREGMLLCAEVYKADYQIYRRPRDLKNAEKVLCTGLEKAPSPLLFWTRWARLKQDEIDALQKKPHARERARCLARAAICLHRWAFHREQKGNGPPRSASPTQKPPAKLPTQGQSLGPSQEFFKEYPELHRLLFAFHRVLIPAKAEPHTFALTCSKKPGLCSPTLCKKLSEISSKKSKKKGDLTNGRARLFEIHKDYWHSSKIRGQSLTPTMLYEGGLLAKNTFKEKKTKEYFPKELLQIQFGMWLNYLFLHYSEKNEKKRAAEVLKKLFFDARNDRKWYGLAHAMYLFATHRSPDELREYLKKSLETPAKVTRLYSLDPRTLRFLLLRVDPPLQSKDLEWMFQKTKSILSTQQLRDLGYLTRARGLIKKLRDLSKDACKSLKKELCALEREVPRDEQKIRRYRERTAPYICDHEYYPSSCPQAPAQPPSCPTDPGAPFDFLPGWP